MSGPAQSSLHPEGSAMPEQPHLTSRQTRTASFILAFVAGYIDSCTFLGLFGLFVAQVTGSFVTFGAQIARGEHAFLLVTLAIPVFILAGSATTFLVALADERRLPALPCCLVLECALLTGFFVAGLTGSPFEVRGLALEVTAGLFGLSAMGVQSALVQLLMRGTPSTNVMTTNTTQLSILATQTLLYWHARRSAPDDPRGALLAATADRLRSVLFVAVGFLIGTIGGALAYAAAEMWCALVPIAAILALLTWAVQPPRLAQAS
jgi:uncharacterized membrane protein YoaK (UPF0700 family)